MFLPKARRVLINIIMKISKKRLKEIASTLLDVMDLEDISSVESLELKIGKEVHLSKIEPDYVSFEKRPSNNTTKAYVISYIVPGGEVPLEIRLNPTLKYTLFILKRRGLPINGYNSFATDPYGNLVQSKKIDSVELPLIKTELSKLVGKSRE
jgi:hypothetical protein